MRNLNQNTERPDNLVQHCAMPIGPTSSTIASIGATFVCWLIHSLPLSLLVGDERF
jgi:hypothetical protein